MKSGGGPAESPTNFAAIPQNSHRIVFLVSMARPRAFDLDEALEKAQAVFWERGYASTTTADLAAAMGIQKGSLFHAFGDKRSLFIQALTRYLDRGTQGLSDRLDGAEDPLLALQGWVEEKAARCATPEGRMGCFGVNSSIGLAARDPELAQVMADYWGKVWTLCTQAIQTAQEKGWVREDQEARSLAHLVMIHLAGMNVIARQGLATDCLRGSSQALFDGFRPSAVPAHPAG